MEDKHSHNKHFHEAKFISPINFGNTTRSQRRKEFISRHPVFKGINWAGKYFPKSRNAKICIIGAGATGLTVAHNLRKVGYKHITILEKEPIIGGKGKAIPDPKGRDLFHDIGSTNIGPTYEWIRLLIKEVKSETNGIEYVSPDSNKIRIYTDDPNYKSTKHGKDYIHGLEKWLFATVEHQMIPKELWFLPEKIAIFPILSDLHDYKKYHGEKFNPYYHHEEDNSKETHRYTFPLNPEKISSNSLHNTIDKEKFHNLQPILLFGSHTYGNVHELSTYYSSYFLTGDIVHEWLNPFSEYPKKSYLKNGWTHFWTAVAKHNNINVITDFNVEKVIRNDSEVTIRGKKKDDDQIYEENFDFLFMAAPPDIEHFPMDWSEDEKSIFSHLIHNIMLISLVEVDPDPHLEDHLFFMLDDILDPNKYYGSEVIVVRDTYRAQRKDLDDRNDRRIQFTVQVSKPENFNLELCTQKIHQFYEKRGNKELNILHQEPWKYFYHFDNEGLDQGIPKKFLEVQGHNRTAFVHSSGGFESLNDAVSLATMIVDSLYTCSAYNNKK